MPGAYFITLCVQHRQCLFGGIGAGEMRLNGAGKMIQTTWNEIPMHYPGIETDAFVIMPNHIHGIIVIPQRWTTRKGQPQGVAPTMSLPDVVHRFKTMTTKRYADGVKITGWKPFPGKLWQRNYWERVVRNESELNVIREYIRTNAVTWETDRLFEPVTGE
jgi:putative transposase